MARPRRSKTNPRDGHRLDPGAGDGRVHAGAQPGQGRPARPGHRRAVLQRRAGAGGEPAGEEGQGFLQLVRNLPQERLSIAMAAVAAARGGARAGRSTTSRSAGRSASRSARSRTAGSCWPRSPPRSRSAQTSSTLRPALNAGELTAVDAAEAKWWMHRAAEAGSSTAACSSTAATAT